MGRSVVDTEFEKVVEEIIQAIKKAGYDPYAQLYGYISTGKSEYITRNGNARERIKLLNWLELKEFIEKMDHE